ncbi:MAG: hypothetical protein GX778_00590 [Erysipelothrix sp.]|nr:hypothetical protein [Erysipelothrix sp.]
MKTINLTQLLHQSQVESLKELIYQQQEQFVDDYQLVNVLDEEVRLIFKNERDAQMFYTDCQFGHRFLKNVVVRYDMNDEKVLVLRPIQSIISLLKHNESSLLTISQKLGINFEVEYIQAFTNHHLTLEIENGQMKNPECTLYVNLEHMTFGLGRLYKLMRDESDFYALNTSIKQIRSETIL